MWTIMDHDVVNIHVRSLCVDICFHFSWIKESKYLCVEMLDPMVNFSTFKENVNVFPKMAVHPHSQ